MSSHRSRQDDHVTDEQGILIENSRNSPVFDVGTGLRDVVEDIRDRDLIDHNTAERGKKMPKRKPKSQERTGRKMTSSQMYNRPGTEGAGNNFRDLQKCLAMYQVYGNEKMAIVNPMTRP